MHQRPPPPRWPPPAPQTPWARPAFIPPLPPPSRGFLGRPHFYSQPPLPPRGFYPRLVPPRPPPPPPRPPVADAEQLWLDAFKRTHCKSTEGSMTRAEGAGEPPLRALRRRVAQAQELVGQLKVAATELAAIEKRLGTLSAASEQHQQAGATAALRVEAPRLRVQRERKLAVCETLKKELEAMNAASEFFPKQQMAQIRAFAAKVKKKKAYRKRAKLRRRAQASIRRAVESNAVREVSPADEDKADSVSLEKCLKGTDGLKEKVTPLPPHPDAAIADTKLPGYLSTGTSGLPRNSIDPETLTIGTLIAVRRAWDSYIVFPQTPGASTIPPHFVPPPPLPSAQWGVYVASSSSSWTPG